MKGFISFAVVILSFSAYADNFSSKIHSIDYSSKKGEPHLIKMENGRVIFVEEKNKKLLNKFESSLRKKEKLDVEVDEKSNPLSIDSAPEHESFFDNTTGESTPLIYDPTIVSSSAAATSIFRRMRRDYQNDSQCYNRAHVWAWEEFKYSGLKSKKHFLFFTRRYIRNYRYKWWFHVSPSAVVKGYGDRILDRRYTGGHRSVSSWVRNFVYSGRSCPVVYKYYDYRNNQETQDCYLIPVSMYFWQPRDIERRDRTGYEKTSFIQSEVDYAYWEAF